MASLGQLVGDIVGGHGLVSSRQEPRKTGRQYGTYGLTYPLDMGIEAPAELDNHIIFDIYIDDSTSFAAINQTTAGEPQAFQGHTAIASQKMRNGLSALGQEGASVGDAISGWLGANVSSGVGAGAKTATDSLNNFAGSVFAGARNMKKLNTSIALAVPNTFTTSSSANWGPAKMGAMGGALARGMEGGVGGIVDKFSNMSGEQATQMTGELARIGLDTAASAFQAFGLNFRDMLEVTTRRVQNSHVEQKFEEMAPREFTFVHEFVGRSKAETDAIDNIIKAFRFHMHPELVESGLYFSYPSLFDITLMFKDKENQYMHKISTCVLTGCTLNYTSTGVFSTNRDGQPTEIQMTLNFREIEVMHKHRIAEGF
ncbi:hypothetical protein N9J18_01105 [Porticoccaceae bacterium]|nr:hypothetical protein [Porticoccaceae bacterium]